MGMWKVGRIKEIPLNVCGGKKKQTFQRGFVVQEPSAVEHS